MLLVLGGAAAVALWLSRGPETTVTVIRPQTRTLRAYVDEQAVTELPRDYLISMPINGWLEPIELREGDPVEAGQVVARLDKADLSDRVTEIEQRILALQTQIERSRDNRLESGVLTEAEAAVKAMDATVKASEQVVKASEAVADYHRSRAERIRRAGSAGAATDLELEEAEMAYRQAEATHQSDAFELAAIKTVAAISHIWPKFVRDYIDLKAYDRQQYQQQSEEAKAALAIAKRNLQRTEIANPVYGVVLHRHQTRRQFLSAGTPLLTVGRLEDMEVVAEVLTERATRVRPDAAVEVYGQAIGDGPVKGRVLRIYPAGFTKVSSLGVEQQRVKVAVKLDTLPARLGVGFRVRVRIFYDEAPDALTLPRTALFRGNGGQWQVIVVRNGRTAMQDVELGLTTEDSAQVLSGLSADDLVVMDPSRELVKPTSVGIRQAQ